MTLAGAWSKASASARSTLSVTRRNQYGVLPEPSVDSLDVNSRGFRLSLIKALPGLPGMSQLGVHHRQQVKAVFRRRSGKILLDTFRRFLQLFSSVLKQSRSVQDCSQLLYRGAARVAFGQRQGSHSDELAPVKI